MIEVGTLQHYPGQLGRFGKLTDEWGSGNRYRCIWAPSRKCVIAKPGGTPRSISFYGAGPSGILRGERGEQSLELLDARLSLSNKIGECWILEIWKAPWDITGGMTKEQYRLDPHAIASGIPYPEKGDYRLCAVFYSVVPTLETIEKQIKLVEDGWKNKRPVENAIAIQANLEKETKQRETTVRDMINNRSLIGAGEAYSAPGMKNGRGTKTVNFRKTAKEMNLPTQPGQTTVRKTNRMFKIPVTG